MLRDAAISLSLANLCFVKVWGKALSGAGAYFSEFRIAYAGILADVLLLALLFFAGITLARRFRGSKVMTLARWSFLVAVLTVLNGVALLTATLTGVNVSTQLGRSPTYFATLALTFGLIALVIRKRVLIIRFAPRVILALLPFVVITFSQAALKLVKDAGVAHAESRPMTSADMERRKAATRVVWIIFDEMDQRLSFDARPPTVAMPELDRLRSQSLYAESAYPPAPLTYMSMPALITGRLVEKVTPLRDNELLLRFAGEQTDVSWSSQPNVFSAARAAGFQTGLAGWCHPYCEVIGGSLSTCEEVKEKGNGDITIKASMFSQAEGLISTIPLVPQIAIPLTQRVRVLNQIVTAAERQKYTIRYRRVLEASLKASTDPNLDLVFIHSPAPHPPGIYNRFTNDFSLASGSSYIDNLELVDRTLGDLRRAMEQAGVWDQTTVIISSDHWWRSEMWSRGPFWTPEDAAMAGAKMDHRIPFLVKPAGTHEQLTYQSGFNTVITHDLVLALLRGDVTDPHSISTWLDSNRTIADSPYNQDELLP